MIIGHSEDKEEDIAQNFDFFDRTNIDFYGEQIITPYPKTGMRDILIKEGLVTNTSDYRKYNGFWANVRTKYLSSEDCNFYGGNINESTPLFLRQRLSLRLILQWLISSGYLF